MQENRWKKIERFALIIGLPGALIAIYLQTSDAIKRLSPETPASTIALSRFNVMYDYADRIELQDGALNFVFITFTLTKTSGRSLEKCHFLMRSGNELLEESGGGIQVPNLDTYLIDDILPIISQFALPNNNDNIIARDLYASLLPVSVGDYAWPGFYIIDGKSFENEFFQIDGVEFQLSEYDIDSSFSKYFDIDTEKSIRHNFRGVFGLPFWDTEKHGPNQPPITTLDIELVCNDKDGLISSGVESTSL